MLSPNDIKSFVNTLMPTGVDLITLHWTVGTYAQTFDDAYHFQILGDGSVHVDSRAFRDFRHLYFCEFEPLAHAWHHNTGNLGISLCGMYGAVNSGEGSKDLISWPSSYGKYPPTQAQIITLCKLTAELANHYKLDPDNNIKTHYQLAEEDGYPGERWEFQYERSLLIKKIKEEMSNA